MSTQFLSSTFRDALTGEYPGAEDLGELRSRKPAGTMKPDATVLDPVTDAVSPGESIGLVVSDATRKTGAERILPVLLAEWKKRGVAADQITVFIACGSHRGPTPAELETILGKEALSACGNKVCVHNALTSKCTRLGSTTRGTPIEVNCKALEMDALVTLGTVVMHYFAGYGGGRKSVVPGLASAAAIAANHSLAVDTAAASFRNGVEIGKLEGNPLAEDLAEAAALVDVRCSIQTVMGAGGEIAHIFAGDPRAAHEDACKAARELYAQHLDTAADIVIASAGAAQNWVQSHKALVNAVRALGDDGVVILCAPCSEGLGSSSLEYWLNKGSPGEIIRGLQTSADINGQTALSTLLRGERAILLTDLPKAAVQKLRMERAASFTDALARARRRLPAERTENPRVLWMPEATLTVPFGGR